MATNSERQIGETLTDSLLMDIMTPGYLPDISALQVPTATYSGIILLYEFIHKHLVMCALISQVYVKTQYLVLTETWGEVRAVLVWHLFYVVIDICVKSLLPNQDLDQKLSVPLFSLLSTYFVIKK